MRIAFATLRHPSHLNAMSSLARKLQERGHEVFFVGVADAARQVRAAGIDFYTVGEREFPVGSWDERDARLAQLSGAAGLKFSIEGACQAFDAVVRDCPEVLRRIGAEAAVFDQLASGYTAVAMQMGLPLIHIAVALPGNPWDCAPPAAVGWPYRTGWLAKMRNRVGHTILRRLVQKYLVRISKHYQEHSVPFEIGGIDFGCSTLAQISQAPAGFDFPNPDLPSWFHQVGPFDNGRRRPEVPFPWERLTGEPLIYASMGTLQNGIERVFRAIVEACSGLGCQLVLSIGNKLKLEELGTLPANCIAVSYAPQPQLLQRAALCITHAGLNTALESLSNGVPMVAIPITNDQPGVGARIEYTRTGIVVPLKKLNTARLRSAVRRVLEDAQYRENAHRLQREIQSTNGLERAADIIEECFCARTQTRVDAEVALLQTV